MSRIRESFFSLFIVVNWVIQGPLFVSLFLSSIVWYGGVNWAELKLWNWIWGRKGLLWCRKMKKKKKNETSSQNLSCWGYWNHHQKEKKEFELNLNQDLRRTLCSRGFVLLLLLRLLGSLMNWICLRNGRSKYLFTFFFFLSVIVANFGNRCISRTPTEALGLFFSIWANWITLIVFSTLLVKRFRRRRSSRQASSF